MMVFNFSILLLVMCHLDSKSARILFLPGIWEKLKLYVVYSSNKPKVLAQVAQVISLALPIFRT